MAPASPWVGGAWAAVGAVAGIGMSVGAAVAAGSGVGDGDAVGEGEGTGVGVFTTVVAGAAGAWVGDAGAACHAVTKDSATRAAATAMLLGSPPWMVMLLGIGKGRAHHASAPCGRNAPPG
ncbi:MAG: hypothetical protein EXR51_10970 [Dehalococcoidia bacterium]|nr:hypothetical protein [Dehalococcoidia bacterium]